jgi:hypothetical protein
MDRLGGMDDESQLLAKFPDKGGDRLLVPLDLSARLPRCRAS